ncbi:MAG TPA: right-handed parallel beta-helix repeat-containing protein [Blastocatellia bacterium]
MNKPMMKKLVIRKLSLMILAAAVLSVPALIVTLKARTVRAATTITVTNTNDSGAGSLRQAIADSESGDTINFNVPLESNIVLTSGELVINSDLTISGPGANLLNISGNNNSRVFSLDSGTGSISGLTVSGGNGSGSLDTTVGGGVLCSGGSFTITSCAVSNSSAVSDGGGVAILGGSLAVNNCAVSGNSCGGSGGGIANLGFALTITNSTIFNNGAAATGGGLFNSGTSSLTNCTISNNTGQMGGGISVLFGSLTINNTIVAGNQSQEGGAEDINDAGFVPGNNNLIQTTGAVQLTGTGNITGMDPMLGPFEINGGPTPTMELGCGSPAIGEGSVGALTGIATDQRSAPRTVDGAVDIGAIEMQNQVTNTNDSGSGSLRDAINNSSANEIIDISPRVTGTITLTSRSIVVGNNVTLDGPGANVLSVSGNNASKVFVIVDGSEEIDGLTITAGNAFDASGGGAVFCDSALTMNSCVISDSVDAAGGGVAVSDGSLTMNGCTVTDCSSTTANGGGILAEGTATLALTNCTLSGNSAAGIGGGFAINSGSAALTNCTISSNSAGDDGGGASLPNIGGTLIINNCIIAGNTGAADPDIISPIRPIEITGQDKPHRECSRGKPDRFGEHHRSGRNAWPASKQWWNDTDHGAAAGQCGDRRRQQSACAHN